MPELITLAFILFNILCIQEEIDISNLLVFQLLVKEYMLFVTVDQK